MYVLNVFEVYDADMYIFKLEIFQVLWYTPMLKYKTGRGENYENQTYEIYLCVDFKQYLTQFISKLVLPCEPKIL